MAFNAKNYTEPGGARTVIGGELVIEKGARLTALPGAQVEGLGGNGGDTPVAGNQPASTATTVAALREDFNGLLAKLKDAGLMAED